MPARAGIVVTGTEVLTGRVQDRNGPWLSDRLRELGVDLAHITICGDRPEDMEAQLAFMAAQGVDLIVTSGGLGPTADDLTTEVVAGFTGSPAVPRRRARGADRRHPATAHEALAQPRLRGRADGEPQAGDGPRGRAGDRSRGHRPRPRGAAAGRRGADGRGAARAPAGAALDVAGGHRGRGVPRGRSAAAPTTSSGCCACSASPSRRSRRPCGSPRARWETCPRSRSPPACGGARWRW